MADPAVTPNIDEYSTPIPQGAAVAAPQADEYSTAIPQGASLGQGGASSVPSVPSPNVPDSLHIGSNDSVAMKAAKGVNAIGAGIGDGILGTLNGAADMFGIPHATLEQKQQELEQQNSENPTLNAVGYGGETLAEFLMGDEALKGLSFADKLSKTGAIAKILESSPRLMKAVQLGVNTGQKIESMSPEIKALVDSNPIYGRILSAGMDAIRAGVVQGTQTTVRTGGDAKQGAKEGAKMAGTTGVLGSAFGAAGGVFTGLGKTAAKTQSLADAAGNAMTHEEVGHAIADKVSQAESDLHTNYETSMQDFAKRLGDNTVDYEGSPLHQAAQSLSAKAADESKPLDTAFNQVRPGSKPVNNMVDLLANPQGDEEAEQTADTWVDHNGETHTEPAPAPEEKQPIIMSMPELIERRQQLAQRLRQTGTLTDENRADKAVYRKLIEGVDDTIGQLAEKSGDPGVIDEYKSLRQNYRDKIGLFDEPVIKKLADGKVDDAAKDFVGVTRANDALPAAGKIRYNTDTLRQVVGDDGLKEFGNQVFGTMLRDSVEDSKFNPAKFVKTWNRVSSETKGDLFDRGKVDYGLSQLAKDAQSAAQLQHLTRIGVLVPAAGAIGMTHGLVGMGLGSLLGFTVAEGGGVAKGREILNYVANHPKVWAAYRAVGDGVNSTGAKAAADVLKIGAGKGVVAATSSKNDAKRRVFAGASSLAQ